MLDYSTLFAHVGVSAVLLVLCLVEVVGSYVANGNRGVGVGTRLWVDEGQLYLLKTKQI